jgi:uncharacterized protein YbjT (DUF2867 family)
MKIIVLGGSGFIGRHVCEKLIAAGHSVTVPTRNVGQCKHLQLLPGLDLLPCDVHDAAQLAAAVAGQEVLVNLVAVLHGSEQRFEQVHVQLPRNIVAACKAATASGTTPRIVHVSALGAALDAPSMYQRSKARGEAVLAQSGLDFAMLRPSVVFGAEDKLLNLFASLQKLAPIVPLAGADTQFQPVWVEDVAQALVLLANDSSYSNNSCSRTIPLGYSPKTLKNEVAHQAIYEACGPEVLTLRDLFAIAGQCVGAKRAILPLPMPMARLQAWVMEHLPGEPLMSRDNLESMKVPNTASGQYPGLAELGITASSVQAIAPTYLGAASALDAYRRQGSSG